MNYCDYCGLDYIKHKCQICGAEIETCGCDCARGVCEEHMCSECGEASKYELDDEGRCRSCLERAAEDREGEEEWHIAASSFD